MCAKSKLFLYYSNNTVMQSFLATAIVIAAVIYLIYFLYKKNKSRKCDDENCGCK